MELCYPQGMDGSLVNVALDAKGRETAGERAER
jgi:hypothetical protein